MEAAERLGAQQIAARIHARLGDIDEVDMLASSGASGLPDLQSAKRAGAIVVHSDGGLGHISMVAFGSVAGYVAEARSTASLTL